MTCFTVPLSKHEKFGVSGVNGRVSELTRPRSVPAHPGAGLRVPGPAPLAALWPPSHRLFRQLPRPVGEDGDPDRPQGAELSLHAESPRNSRERTGGEAVGSDANQRFQKRAQGPAFPQLLAI